MFQNRGPEPNAQVPVPRSLDLCKVFPSNLALKIELGELRQCNAISFLLNY